MTAPPTPQNDVPRQHRPCRECPWQVAAALGTFPPERYEDLHETSIQPENWAGEPQPMFGCHAVPPRIDREAVACAGWLAVGGRHNFAVRIAVAVGRLPAEALEPSDDWPELYESYEAMAAANGVRASNPPTAPQEHQ